MTGGISPRTCDTKLNFDFPYVRFLSLRRDPYYTRNQNKLSKCCNFVLVKLDTKFKMLIF